MTTWRDEYNGIPGKDYAAHNAARILLMDVLTGLSQKAGLKREFHPARYESDGPGRLRTLALVNAHLPDEYACEVLNELPPDVLSGAAHSIARHYGVEPTKAPLDAAGEAVAAPRAAKAAPTHTPLAWGPLGQ